jgi:Pyruvate/2-oxoacid:ferredoxin oxidoreductase delta subunit
VKVIEMGNQPSLYEKLVKKSTLMFGKIPNEEAIVWALSQTLPEDDLRIYFLIPFGNAIPLKKLQEKAARLGYSPDQLAQALERMYREAFVMRHATPEGPAYESCPLSMAAEQQVRMKKATPVGKAYADYWLSLANVSAYNLPTRTPYFRVLPVEATITAPESGEIQVNYAIPDPREILPLDVVSEMVQNQRVIGVAECYCRLSCDMQDDHCDKPRETCFVFNQFAQSLIELGVARQLTVEEALHILRECEKVGLVHNIDNFQGEIRGLCNCCACHCPGMKATARGKKNVEAVSRYMPVYAAEKCVFDHACIDVCPIHAIDAQKDGSISIRQADCFGCGLCVSVCPEGALQMVVREKAPKVPRTAQALQDALMREVVVGLVINKITGRS